MFIYVVHIVVLEFWYYISEVVDICEIQNVTRMIQSGAEESSEQPKLNLHSPLPDKARSHILEELGSRMIFMKIHGNTLASGLDKKNQLS